MSSVTSGSLQQLHDSLAGAGGVGSVAFNLCQPLSVLLLLLQSDTLMVVFVDGVTITTDGSVLMS